MADPDAGDMPNARPSNKKKEHSDALRQEIAQSILFSMVEGQLPHGALAQISGEKGISQPCVSRIFSNMKKAARVPTDLSTVDMTQVLSKNINEAAKLFMTMRRCLHK